MDLVLVVVYFKLVAVVHDHQTELLLVDVRLRYEREVHVCHGEGTHAPLLDNVARLSLEPLVEVEDHRHACHTQFDHEVCIALLLLIFVRGCNVNKRRRRRRVLTHEIDGEMCLFQIEIRQLNVTHE